MADESFQEKTERATPKKRQQAREEGNVARSVEINSAVVLFFGTLVLYVMSGWLMNRMRMGMVVIFREAPKITLNVEDFRNLAIIVIQFMAINIIPFAIALLLIGVAANVAQVGWLFSPKSLKPKFSKLNPIEGVKRFFSVKSIVELFKGIIKIAIVGYFVYGIFKEDFESYQLLIHQNIASIVSALAGFSFKILIKTAAVFLLLAILDYTYQKYDYEKNLRMSKEDIKDEFKQAEGDPKVKGKLKSMQRQFLLNAMINELPDADVVVTNPVHLAVALKYDSEKMEAPKVVAKGARKIAERIKKIAREHNIPIVENVELARALYKTVDVGKEVPGNLYKAVAEVLSYVYRLKNKRFG